MSARHGRKLVDARSGGFVIAGAVLLFLLVAARWIIPAARQRGERAPGDGRHVESYGFDLSGALVATGAITPAGIPRDGIPALTLPPLFGAAEAAAAPLGEHGKFLVPSDLVIGITSGGASRCYPLRVMNWHEAVNDTLGSRPVLVTFNPPSFGVAAFDRRVGGDTLQFGVSGLLYQSNLLVYDRGAPGRSSLWSQLLAKGVAGPRAGTQLRLLPVALVTWGDWLAAHPATTVLAGENRRSRDYERDPYAAYYSSEGLRFPVDPLPTTHVPAWKTTVLVIGEGAGASAFTLADIAAHVDAAGEWRTLAGGREVVIRYRPDPPCAALEWSEADNYIPTRYAFFFAWNAMMGGAPIGVPGGA
jgi:hypothetical protein